jgi:hypothetical protein
MPDNLEVLPGERYRVTYEGTVILNGSQRPALRTDEGTYVALLSEAKVEKISPAPLLDGDADCGSGW